MLEVVGFRALPTEVLSKICCHLLGEPWYLRLRDNKLLKRIQMKYKYFVEIHISDLCTGDEIERGECTLGIELIFNGQYLALSYLDYHLEKLFNAVYNEVALHRERGAVSFRGSMMINIEGIETDFQEFSLESITEALERSKTDANFVINGNNVEGGCFVLTVLLTANY